MIVSINRFTLKNKDGSCELHLLAQHRDAVCGMLFYTELDAVRHSAWCRENHIGGQMWWVWPLMNKYLRNV